MKTLPVLLLLVLFVLKDGNAQKPPDKQAIADFESSAKAIKPLHKTVLSANRILTETCGNNSDDDGNGLTDCNDFNCYFNAASGCLCSKSDIIWVNGDTVLLWVDLATGTEHKVGTLPIKMNDITWTLSGKLYAMDLYYSRIFELDPYTGDTTFVMNLPVGYDFANGITSDYQGNLYLAARFTPNQWHIIKLDIITGQFSVVADLSTLGLIVSGDVTFLDGTLYAICENFQLVKIDLYTGAITVSTITGVPTNNIWGMVSTGDGNLYLGNNNEIYRLDTLTMQATLVYRINLNLKVYGMANYQEPCNTPVCKAKVEITAEGNLPYCKNSGPVLRANGSGLPGPGIYTWTLPDGTMVSGPDSLPANQTGNYYVRYHTDPDSCGASDSVFIQLEEAPLTDLGADTTICEGTSILLKPVNTANVTAYIWQDGSSSKELNTNGPGWYWLEQSNACDASRDSVFISEIKIPVTNLGTDTALCQGTNITLQASDPADATNYFWQDGSTSEQLTTDGPGIYWLVQSNSCGASVDSIFISEAKGPYTNIGNDTALCEGTSLVLRASDSSGGVGYLWQDGSASPQLTISGPGLYWLEQSNVCGLSRDSVLITEIKLPVTNIGTDTALCEGTNITLQPSNSTDVTSFLWQDGSASQQSTTNAPGIYWLEQSNSCGLSRDSVLITEIKLPATNIGTDTALCEGTNITLQPSNSTDVTSFLWQDGSASQQSITNGPGIYWLEQSNSCGLSRDSVLITEIKLPVTNIGADTALCEGTNITLQPSNSTNVTGFLWQDGSTSQQLTTTGLGLYWLEQSNTCGSSRDSVLISVIKQPSVDLGRDTSICEASPITLFNHDSKETYDIYNWSDGSSDDQLNVSSAGTYWLISKNNCFSTTDSITILPLDYCTCHPFLPKADLGPDQELCQYDTLKIENYYDREGYTYKWQDGSANNYYLATVPGIYWTDVSTQCATVRDTILVHEKTSGCECNLYMPTGFTPNHDGRNDSFRALSDCSVTGEMFIYDRWGKLMYRTTELSKGWDGTYKSFLLPTGVFVYYVNYKFRNRPGIRNKKGFVTLIR